MKKPKLARGFPQERRKVEAFKPEAHEAFAWVLLVVLGLPLTSGPSAFICCTIMVFMEIKV